MITSIFPVGLFFYTEEERFFKKTCIKLLGKQLLSNEIKIYYLYIYCTLSTTLTFNFEILFEFIKIFQKYLKQPTYKIGKKVKRAKSLQ